MLYRLSNRLKLHLTEPDSVIPIPIIVPPRMLLKTVSDVKPLANFL